MWESLFQSRDFGVVMVFGLIFGSVVATSALSTWRKHHATKMAHELKMEMVARGMTADDIERVLKSKGDSVDSAESDE